jgi:hypothetical protein
MSYWCLKNLKKCLQVNLENTTIFADAKNVLVTSNGL